MGFVLFFILFFNFYSLNKLQSNASSSLYWMKLPALQLTTIAFRNSYSTFTLHKNCFSADTFLESIFVSQLTTTHTYFYLMKNVVIFKRWWKKNKFTFSLTSHIYKFKSVAIPRKILKIVLWHIIYEIYENDFFYKIEQKWCSY